MSMLTSKIEFYPHDEGVEIHLLDLNGDPREAVFLNADYDLMRKGMEVYISGALIQNAFPFLNASQREFLLTGLTDDEWDELFEEDE